VFDSRWTYDGKNSPEFERTVTMMHESSPWMLGEEEGLSENLTNYSSGRRSDECGRVARSGGGSNLSSGESEFLRKRNSKEGGEWMQWQIMSFPVTFIGRRREGR
jgi:hypothetical protein